MQCLLGLSSHVFPGGEVEVESNLLFTRNDYMLDVSIKFSQNTNSKYSILKPGAVAQKVLGLESSGLGDRCDELCLCWLFSILFWIQWAYASIIFTSHYRPTVRSVFRFFVFVFYIFVLYLHLRGLCWRKRNELFYNCFQTVTIHLTEKFC